MVVAFRIGAVILAFVSLGFGIPGVIGALHYSRTGTVWQFMGFPTYGPGAFERWGVPLSTGLLLGFVGVCALGFVAAVLLWFPAAALVGAIVGLAAIILQGVFWFGFQLPFGPPLGVAAGIAIVAGLVLRASASSN